MLLLKDKNNLKKQAKKQKNFKINWVPQVRKNMSICLNKCGYKRFNKESDTQIVEQVLFLTILNRKIFLIRKPPSVWYLKPLQIKISMSSFCKWKTNLRMKIKIKLKRFKLNKRFNKKRKYFNSVILLVSHKEQFTYRKFNLFKNWWKMNLKFRKFQKLNFSKILFLAKQTSNLLQVRPIWQT